jgi:hypothetical protein
MGLAEVQTLMAHVYTDATIRGRFFEDPAALGGEYGLAPDELGQFEQLFASQVRFAAAALRHKRLNGVAKLMPLSRQMLGEHFARLFTRHAEAYAPSGIRRHRGDALAFAAFVERLAHSELIEPAAALDQLRYEAAWLQAADATPCWIVRRFHQPIRTRRADGGEQVQGRRLRAALWVRVRPGGRLRHLVFMLRHPAKRVAGDTVKGCGIRLRGIAGLIWSARFDGASD